MALDSLQAKGLNAEVKVYVFGTCASQWGALYQSEELRGMDLYIGPFHRAALESLVRVAGDAPISSPFPRAAEQQSAVGQSHDKKGARAPVPIRLSNWPGMPCSTAKVPKC